jgi:hypothetical protein
VSEATERTRLSGEEEHALFQMMWWLRAHPMHRPYLLYGLWLAPHQRIVWRALWKAMRIGLKLSRGLSKTFIDGLYVVDKSFMYSGSTSIVLTRGFRGGKLVFTESCEKIIASTLASQDKCDFALYSMVKPSNIINKGSDLWQIKFSHGSQIATGPLGHDLSETSPLRGLRANAALVLDESADIGDELYTSVISPFGRVARDPVGEDLKDEGFGYTKVESGTVRYDYQRYTKFLEECEKKMDSGDERFAVIEFNYEDAFYYEDNDKTKPIVYSYRLNLEDLFADYNSGITSYDDFMSENKNVVQKAKDQEFPPQLIESITGVDPSTIFNRANERSIKPLSVCEEPCVLGIDPARESADAAFVVARVGILRPEPVEYSDVIYAKTAFRAEFSELYKIIRQILNQYPGIMGIYMDQGGGGLEIRDRLWRPDDGLPPIYDPLDENTPEEVRSAGLPILHLDAASNEKNTTRVNFVKAQMESCRLLLPDYTVEYRDRYLDEALKATRRLGRQFTYIVSKPSGNWKKYEVGESRLKKDLFSATLLAAQGIYDCINNSSMSAQITEEYAWV